MLLLNPIRSTKVWGYENWIASTHPNGAQKEFVDAVGNDFPLLVKVIQANETLSVQVHPDDEKAVLLEGNGSRGKTECWYVLSADKNAKLVYGLNGVYSKSELEKAIDEQSLESFLNFVPVKKGDFIFIPSGTVHAIGGGLRLLEVQQSCDITYRLYDWGRPRELHVKKGIEVIKSDELPKISNFSGVFGCEYFSLAKLNAKKGLNLFSSKNSFYRLLFVIKGKAKVLSNKTNETLTLQKEDIIAIAPGETLSVKGNASLMYIWA